MNAEILERYQLRELICEQMGKAKLNQFDFASWRSFADWVIDNF